MSFRSYCLWLAVSCALLAPACACAETYTYDGLGRLITVVSDTGTQTQYAYDADGNRLTQSVTQGGPSAVPDTMTVPYGGSATIDPRANDVGPSGHTLTVNGVTQPAHGTSSFTGTSVTYKAATGFAGADSFTYSIINDLSQTATGPISVNVVSQPVAHADSITVTSGSSITFDPRTNDTDPAGEALTIIAVSTPSHGAATFTGTSVTYTPSAGYAGADSFTYTISNTSGGVATATISATVSAATLSVAVSATSWFSSKYEAEAPVSAPAIYVTPSGGSGVYTYSWQQVSGDANTTIQGGTTSTVTWSRVFVGFASWTSTWHCVVTDSNGVSATSPNVVVTFEHDPISDVPVPTNDSISVQSGGSITFDPRTNDTDPAGLPLTITAVGTPSNGTASFTATSVTYTGAAGYSGSDSFTYTISNGEGGTASATISVTVLSAPTAGPVSANVPYNTQSSIPLTPGGSYSSVAIVSPPSHGSASISGTSALYTPTSGYQGPDSFTYDAVGPGGTSPAATVSITVSPPSPPTAGAVSGATAYNTAVSIPLAPGGIYTSLILASSPSKGSASISGTTATYTPLASFYGGTDSFTYESTGPGGTSSPGTVTVTVGNPPPPTAANISPTITYTANTFNLAITGVFNSVSFPTGPSYGVITASGATVTYSPQGNYYGTDVFSYKASGPGGTSNTASINLTIQQPAAPTVSPITTTVTYNATTPIVANPGGVWDSVSIGSQPSHGTATEIGAATLDYTPTAYYYGADSFTYCATGPGGTSCAPVNVTVPQPPPSALAVSLSTTTWTAMKDGTTVIDDPNITVSASGGTPGYTYTWILVSGDTTTTVQGSNNVFWSRNFPTVGNSAVSVWECRVTDAAGNTALSPQITVTFEHLS